MCLFSLSRTYFLPLWRHCVRSACLFWRKWSWFTCIHATFPFESHMRNLLRRYVPLCDWAVQWVLHTSVSRSCSPPEVPVLCLVAVSLSWAGYRSTFAWSCGMMEELSSVTGFLNEQKCFSHKLHSLIPQMPPTMSSFVLKYLFFWVEEEGNPFQSCKEHFKRGLTTLKFWVWWIERRWKNKYIIKYFNYNYLMFRQFDVSRDLVPPHGRCSVSLNKTNLRYIQRRVKKSEVSLWKIPAPQPLPGLNR